jgi:hypothetical protein
MSHNTCRIVVCLGMLALGAQAAPSQTPALHY